ncbi:MAG: PKD domain-containing protein [Bacteroidia bacterium]|nr:PKD domain-containing protein [Bacteroidia bacterium]
MNKLFAFLWLIFTSFLASAQITLQGNGAICLGDLAFFNYTPPSGKSVTSHTWDFGDGYTSNHASPGHLYKAKGTYTVSVTVGLSGGGTAKESLKVEVLGLPEPKLSISPTSDTCQYTSNVCIVDNSSLASPGQTIVTRNITWGDGQLTIDNNPGATNTICHSFPTRDNYEIKMEVVDNQGCKSSATRTVTILPGVKAQVRYKLTYPDCETARLCLTNHSSFSAGENIDFKWTVDGQTYTKEHFNNDPLCLEYKSTKSVKVDLYGTSDAGCDDETSTSIDIDLSKEVKRITLSDSTPCYGDQFVTMSINSSSSDQVTWRLNGEYLGNSSSRMLNFLDAELDPGVYELTCLVERDNCSTFLKRKLVIHGPKVEISIFNQFQCRTNRKIFFIDRSLGINPKNTVFKWSLTDPDGENCTIDRARKINKYKNCNTTIGWFAKHQYTNPGTYPFVYTIRDTVTGCSGEIAGLVSTNRCGNCGPGGSNINEPIKLCQSDLFLGDERREGDPIAYSLDTGKNWKAFRTIIGPEYVGIRDVILVYKYGGPLWAEDYGDDSIKIHESPYTHYDTIRVPKFVDIIESKKDSVSFEFNEGCGPFTATVRLKDGSFEPGDQIWISWGDGGRDTVDFTSNTVRKSFKHKYSETGGRGTIDVKLLNKNGCYTEYSEEYVYGFKVFTRYNGLCVEKTACVSVQLIDVNNGEVWRPDNKYGSFKILVDETDSTQPGEFSLCGKFGLGEHESIIRVTTSKECTYEVKDTFIIQQVVAGATRASKLFYCEGLMEFKDSSKLVYPDPEDKISSYAWDFGTGYFGTWEKNPIKAFDGRDKNLTVRHMIRSRYGCTDTIEYNLRVLKSIPKFEVDDTLGCAPLTIELSNTSEGSSHFIWELGDTGNITVETTDSSAFTYTYNSPGQYDLHLIGVDSFYSDLTKQTYYCHTIYPELSATPITVTILPSAHPGIDGPDTVCVGDLVQFTSLSQSVFEREIWKLPDGAIRPHPEGHQVEVNFPTAGTYSMFIEPMFKGHSVVPQCISEIEKRITVVEVDAQFSIDASSKSPNFKFTNHSTPANAGYSWNFGDEASGADNFSTETHPSHSFVNGTGTFEVCLTATTPNGCKDVYCEPIEIDYQLVLETYNVFTPGNGDGVNDLFAIVLRGESAHELSIFNRWGEVVYSSASMHEVENLIYWNGKINNTGAICPAGTYFYVLKYADHKHPDEFIKHSGTVTLIRD